MNTTTIAIIAIISLTAIISIIALIFSIPGAVFDKPKKGDTGATGATGPAGTSVPISSSTIILDDPAEFTYDNISGAVSEATSDTCFATINLYENFVEFSGKMQTVNAALTVGVPTDPFLIQYTPNTAHAALFPNVVDNGSGFGSVTGVANIMGISDIALFEGSAIGSPTPGAFTLPMFFTSVTVGAFTSTLIVTWTIRYPI